jgi:hypothetical protein
VYHRWTEAGRVLAIDRMDFTGKRMFVVGATHTPQPAPFKTQKRCGTSTGDVDTGLYLADLPTSFVCEITHSFGEPSDSGAQARFYFATAKGGLALVFDLSSRCISLAGTAPGAANSIFRLPIDFDLPAKHLLRIDSDYRKLKITLDNGVLPPIQHFLPYPVETLSLQANDFTTDVSSLELTEGFEELFEDEIPLRSNGWHMDGSGDHRFGSGEMFLDAVSTFELTKHRPLGSCEFAANIRITDQSSDGEFGLALRAGEKDVLRFSVMLPTSSFSLGGASIGHVPDEVQLNEYHQLRIIKTGTAGLCYFDDMLVREVEVDDVATKAFIFLDRVPAAIEMIRLTAI